MPALRPGLELFAGYHSAQVEVEVRLNTNESPYPPPASWQEDLAGALATIPFHRYPDRQATALRAALGHLHGVDAAQVFCANGSNEVLQSLLLAYGGPQRRAVVFEPTYALHSHIARVTGTEVETGRRARDYRIDLEPAAALVRHVEPAVVFLCSPNNPTGGCDTPDLVAGLLEASTGLVVVDEAYGQFSSWSALDLRRPQGVGGVRLAPELARRLVVVRTFSKTWAMAGVRLGYLVGDPEVVAACDKVVLPYHLSAIVQAAGVLALSYHHEMVERVALVTAERDRLAGALADMAVDVTPSEANFILFQPKDRAARVVWKGLVDHSVLVRDCSGWPGLEGCLRVTVGTPTENDRFLEALAAVLAEPVS